MLHTVAPFKAVPDNYKEIVKGKLWPGIDDFIDNLLLGLKCGDRTAMNVYPKALGLMGAEMEFNINVLASKELGMSLADAKQKLQLVESLRDIADGDALSLMEEHVRSAYRAKGYKVLIVKDEAVAETNGHTR